MPFQTLAVPFDTYAALPSPQARWVLMALARYADRDGRCWPSMRQLARDARMSKSSVQRYLADLSQLGVFSRSRRPGGRYQYSLGKPYRPGAMPPKRTVPNSGIAVPHNGGQKVLPIKHQDSPDDSAYVPRWPGGVSSRKQGVPQDGKPHKNQRKKHEYIKSIAVPNQLGLHDDSSQWRASERPSRIHEVNNVSAVKEKPGANHGNYRKRHETYNSQENNGRYFSQYINHDDTSQWRARLNAWRQSGGRFWNPFWGPKPGEAGYWGPQPR